MRRIFILVFSGAVFLALKSCVFGRAQIVNRTTDSAKATTVYHIDLKTLNGSGQIDLSAFKGKKILIVNTASECGYTPQYEALQKLYDQKKDKLVIIGCPCNQFGAQEPGDSTSIREFCTKKYQVTFILSEKLDVKGSNQHPLYKWLTNKSENGVLNSDVKWNFNKYLIDVDGKLLAYFPSRTKPDDPELLKLIDK